MQALQVGLAAAFLVSTVAADESLQIPSWTHNHLTDARVEGNLETFGEGVRGKADHIVYDLEAGAFLRVSNWHEYGVGLGKNIGIVPESAPAYWLAEWDGPVTCNLIALSGCYPNQPQPETGWKIELRSGATWREHARGKGGWYDNGRYRWQVPIDQAVEFDALRVSLFSANDETPLESIHFRGEGAFSWVVASIPDIDVTMAARDSRVRLGEPVKFHASAVRGEVDAWTWDFGDGSQATGETVSHAYAQPGEYTALLTFRSGAFTAALKRTVFVGPPVEARLLPLSAPVVVGAPVALDAGPSMGPISAYEWDMGDGATYTGKSIAHTYGTPGVYEARLRVRGDGYEDASTVLLRVLADKGSGVPQLLLDTDQKNEQDDQYFLGYAIFSEMDLLGVNSVHHGGGQEQINYDEIIKVRDLAKQSGAADERIPRVFRGADKPLVVPSSGQWSDTAPVETGASEAILAAVRGASPDNPVWIVPVGPGTNVASAILLARDEGLELKDRMRVMWLGGSNDAIVDEFNGNNDPWSLYVIAESGVPLWIMPAPVGARVRIDKRTESDWYPDNPLGKYLEEITPAYNKPLFDPAVLSAIIDLHLDRGWITHMEGVQVGGPEAGYQWHAIEDESSVILIREIDQQAMKVDLFDTLKGKATEFE